MIKTKLFLKKSNLLDEDLSQGAPVDPPPFYSSLYQRNQAKPQN